MIPINTGLGKLSMVEIYEYYDIPRLFSVRDVVGTLYLVYWCDEIEDSSVWLYLPISESRLTDMRHRKVSLRTAYAEPQNGYWIVHTSSPDAGRDQAYQQRVLASDSPFLPPEGFYIEYAEVIEKESLWSLRAYLNRSGDLPGAGTVSRFISALKSALSGFIEPSGRTLQLTPVGTLPGSLDLRFVGSDETLLSKSLSIANELFSQDEEAFINGIRTSNIDPFAVREFLSSVVDGRLHVDLEPKFSSQGATLNLDPDTAQRYLSYIEKEPWVIVRSIKVPQANDLDTVLRIIGLIRKGAELTPESLGDEYTAPRQVAYYRDAASALDLVDDHGRLTNQGDFVASLPDRASKMRALVQLFNTSEIGWAWIRWSKVEDMSRLDPETAEAFLLACAPSLSASTAHRRASTLKQWHSQLIPFATNP